MADEDIRGLYLELSRDRNYTPRNGSRGEFGGNLQLNPREACQDTELTPEGKGVLGELRRSFGITSLSVCKNEGGGVSVDYLPLL